MCVRPPLVASSLRKCDKICVVHAGTVVEEGSHEELMSMADGRYKALVEAGQGSSEGTGAT